MTLAHIHSVWPVKKIKRAQHIYEHTHRHCRKADVLYWYCILGHLRWDGVTIKEDGHPWCFQVFREERKREEGIQSKDRPLINMLSFFSLQRDFGIKSSVHLDWCFFHCLCVCCFSMPLFILKYSLLCALMVGTVHACMLKNHTFWIERQGCGQCVAINTTICSGYCYTQVTTATAFHWYSQHDLKM